MGNCRGTIVGFAMLAGTGLFLVTGCTTAPNSGAKDPLPLPSTSALSHEDQAAIKADMEAAQEELRTGKPAPLPKRTPPLNEPKPPLPSNHASQKTVRCESSVPPAWVRQTAPWQAMGQSTVSQEEADRHARLEVVKSLEVKIDAVDRSSQQETSAEGFSYSASSEVMETVQIAISGLDIVDRYADPCGAHFFALARLDRDRAVNAWGVELENLQARLGELSRHATSLQEQGEALRALGVWYQLLDLDATARQLDRRLRYLAAQQAKGESRAVLVEQARRQFESLLASLKLVKAAGDEQRAVIAPQLGAPLVVRAMAGDHAIQNLPIQFRIEAGKAEVDAHSVTDSQGLARATVHHIQAEDREATIIVRVSLEEALADYPEALRKRVLARQDQLMARFTMRSPVYHHLARLRELTDEAVRAKKVAAQHEAQGDVLRVLLSLAQLREAQESWAKVADHLNGTDSEQRKGLAGPGDAGATHQEIQTVLGSLQVKKISGDQQRAFPGQPLAQPLRMQIVGILGGKEQGVAELPLQLSFEKGQGELDRLLRTDAAGHVDASVRKVEPSEHSVTVLARVALDQLALDLTSSLRDQLARHFDAQAIRFTLIPPATSGDSSLLGKALYALAHKLAQKVNTSEKVLTVVREFVEARSSRRFAISGRFESGLASALSGFGTLRILEVSPGAMQTKNDAVTQAEAELVGVYERDPAGGVWLSAKLIRLPNHVTEAWEESTIARTAFSDEDLRELGLLQAPPKGIVSSIVPTPSHDQNFHQWVEAFWDLRNPYGFHTELVAERKEYRIKEAATFRFRTTRDCYLTVVNIGASGQVNLLLPNRWRPTPQDTLVRSSDGWVSVPSAIEDYQFEVFEPLGTERVKAVCSTRPLRLFENANFKNGLFTLSPTTAGLMLNTTAMRPEEWSEVHASVITLGADQTETQGLRGLKSRGLVTK
ncbi:MAG TPA: DUF4384 domain-containing protein [Nitrospira sp.]|nr:DUF4384 domain-containing protein [Nitrospira sp.]